MVDAIKIGIRIKQRRTELQMTQEQLGAMLQMNKSTIQRYESGQINNIKLPVLQAIAEQLDVDPSWLACKTPVMGKFKKPDSLPPEKPAPLNNELWAEICADPEKLRLVERIVSLPTDKLRNLVNFLQSFDDGDKK